MTFCWHSRFQCLFSDCERQIADDKLVSHVLEEHDVNVLTGDSVPFSCILNFSMKEDSYFAEKKDSKCRKLSRFFCKACSLTIGCFSSISKSCVRIPVSRIPFCHDFRRGVKRYFHVDCHI